MAEEPAGPPNDEPPGAEAPLPAAEGLRPRRFSRAALLDALPEPQRQRLEEETYQFLKRRFRELAEQFDDISKTNFNPFLLLITAPVYNIYSPYEVAERLQLGKAFHGDDTAFGRMAEEKYLNIFGARPPMEKSSEDPAVRRRWSPIDLELTIDGQRNLMSIKAGPWTMNQSHASEMIRSFKQLHEETGAKILIGITYGRYKNLNNKPALVERELGTPDWFDFFVGKDFWEYATGVRNVHLDMFAAIRIAQKRFADEYADRTFSERLIENRLSIASSLRKSFSVRDDEDFWGTLFNAMFESKAGLPGQPDEVPPLPAAEEDN
jgi:hypothetical protein